MDLYLKFGEDITNIDVTDEGKPIRNRWQWSWLSEVSDDGFEFNTWCKKPRKSGVCMCTVCGKSVVYGSSGKKALKKHANLEDHKTAVRSLTNSTKLAGASITTAHTKECLQDLVNENKAVISLFIAEHCLPFAIAPELLQLAQRLNNSALQSTTLSRKAATYVTSHGVGESIRNDLSEKLKDKFFSLNVDEATNKAGNKFLNVIVQYFDDELQAVCNQLLGTREVNIATSANITSAVQDILANMGLNVEQVVSITMDNCNVMRGKKQGVETQIRTLHPSLLDVSGDTLHMVNNTVKKFFSIIDSFFDVQSLASDVYYDIEYSPKVRSLFGQVLSILCPDKAAKSIIRPISNRFLQMNTVADRFIDLWDGIWVYYSAFLTLEERKQYAGKVKAVLDKWKVPEEKRPQLWKILEQQRKQAKTDANNDRKSRILNALFDHKNKTLLLLNLYKGITEKFVYFSKKYQSSKPQMHDLHCDLFSLTKEFLAGFIMPDVIPECSVKHLKDLDLDDRSHQLKDRELGTGKYCLPLLQLCLKDREKNFWLKEFFCALRQAYIIAAKDLMKLPLGNETLTHLSYLSPGLQRNTKTVAALSGLARKLPKILTPTEQGMLDEEARAYTVDDVLSVMAVNEEDSHFRLDKDWWVHVMSRKTCGQLKYPVLSKMVKALLSVFTGPIVESSFNIMGDILEEDRTRLTTYNYESLAMIKSSLSAKGERAVTADISQKMKHDVCYSYSKYQKFLQQAKDFSPREQNKEASSFYIAPSTSSLTTSQSPTHETPKSKASEQANASPSRKTKDGAAVLTSSSNPPHNVPSKSPISSEVPLTSLPENPNIPAPNQPAKSMKRKQVPIMDFFIRKNPKIN